MSQHEDNAAGSASHVTEAMIDRVLAAFPNQCPVCTYDGLWPPQYPGEFNKEHVQSVRQGIREMLELALSELPVTRTVRPGDVEEPN